MPRTISSFGGDHRWLSNFYPCAVMWGELQFPSVEHAYQAAKTTDIDIQRRFQTITAGQAKRLGRTIDIRHDWSIETKLGVMEYLLNQKFCNDELRAKLLATGDTELIEGNQWGDTFWGVNERGQGFNHLGRLLMKIRSQLSA